MYIYIYIYIYIYTYMYIYIYIYIHTYIPGSEASLTPVVGSYLPGSSPAARGRLHGFTRI